MGIRDLTNVSAAKMDLANDDAMSTTSTATVQVGEHDLGQVADRLGVSKQDLLQANPQIKDPSKLTVGQDIHVPDKGKTGKADSDDGSHAGKTKDTDKHTDSRPKVYGDPIAASAMKGMLDGTQGGNTKTNDVSKHKDTDPKLPPDEEAVRNAGGDKALKGYQQFKAASAEVSRQAYVTGQGQKVGKELKELDDIKKKLEANPSDPKTKLEFQQKYDQLQKDIKPLMDAMNKDPKLQPDRQMQEMEKLQREQAEKAIREAS